MIVTTDYLDALLYIRNGTASARWNFPAAVGSSIDQPAGVGEFVELTYAFLATDTSYESHAGFLSLDAWQQQAARDVLECAAEVAGLAFVEAAASSQLTLAMAAQPAGQGGYAYPPAYSYYYSGSQISSVTEYATGGDIWLNATNDWTTDDFAPAGHGFATLLHELGHALGLKHPFETSGGDYVLDTALDDKRHTIMSYTQPANTYFLEVTGSASSYSYRWYSVYPDTFMPGDIEALQYLYGVNQATRSGDDTYLWEVNEEFVRTLWDGGGVDTIDCANQTLPNVINLEPGSHSSIALRANDADMRAGLDLPSWFSVELPEGIYDGRDNLAIAAGAWIENAIGGGAADTLTGNVQSNHLTGGLGNDTLEGGAGADTAAFGGSRSAYSLTLGSDGTVTVMGTDGTDTLTGVELLEFAEGGYGLTEAIGAQLSGARHYAKVQAYFLGVLGREATAEEAATFTAILQSNQSRVWWNAEVSTLMGTDSLMGYLMNQAEYAALIASDTATMIGTIYTHLTGQTASQDLLDHYAARVGGGTLSVQGITNKLLGELYLSPKGDGTLGTVAGFTDNRGYLDGEAYMGYLTALDAIDGIGIANLDASGNLTVVGVG